MVAIAAGAEHHDEAAAHVRPQRLDRLGERIGLVRVVDEDRRAVASADQLEPPLGAFEIFERMEHRRGIAAGRDRLAGRHQRVLDLESADQRQAHPMGLARVRQPQRLGEAVDRVLDQPDAVAAAADRHHGELSAMTTAAPPGRTTRSNSKSLAAR